MEEKNISLVYISVAVKVTGTQLTRVYKSFTGMTFLTFIFRPLFKNENLELM